MQYCIGWDLDFCFSWCYHEVMGFPTQMTGITATTTIMNGKLVKFTSIIVIELSLFQKIGQDVFSKRVQYVSCFQLKRTESKFVLDSAS